MVGAYSLSFKPINVEIFSAAPESCDAVAYAHANIGDAQQLCAGMTSPLTTTEPTNLSLYHTGKYNGVSASLFPVVHISTP